MADWFTEMVKEVSNEVIKSSETESKLALAERVNAENLKAAAVNSEPELRTQFADNVRAIQEIRDDTQRAEDASLVRENQALLDAMQRAQAAQDGTPERASWIRRLGRRLHIGQPCACRESRPRL